MWRAEVWHWCNEQLRWGVPRERVRAFSSSHRTGFNDWVNSLQHSSMTPSHLMIKNAGEFMQTTGVWNPYAKVPGTTEAHCSLVESHFRFS